MIRDVTFCMIAATTFRLITKALTKTSPLEAAQSIGARYWACWEAASV